MQYTTELPGSRYTRRVPTNWVATKLIPMLKEGRWLMLSMAEVRELSGGTAKSMAGSTVVKMRKEHNVVCAVRTINGSLYAFFRLENDLSSEQAVI